MLKRSFTVLCVSVFVASIGVGIVTPILPIYFNELSKSGFVLGAFFSAFFLSMAIFTPLVGRLSDKINKKFFITWGLALTAIISLAYIWVTNPTQLLLVRFLNGITVAMLMPALMAYVGELIPVGQEGSYMGIYSMSMFFGVAAGPVMGGVIYDWGGIAPPFYACALGLGIAFFVTTFLLPRQASKAQMLIAKSPLKAIIASGPLKGIFIFTFISTMAQSGLMIFLPLLANKQHLSMSQIGILASSAVIFIGVMQVPFGWLANRWNKGKLVIYSSLLVGVGLACLPLAQGFVPLLLLGSLFGIASALGIPAANALLIELSREIGLGVVSGSLNSCSSVANIIGPLIAGVVMDIINLDSAFYLLALSFVVGTVIFYYLARPIIECGPRCSIDQVTQEYQPTTTKF